jgi:hypothetical protein
VAAGGGAVGERRDLGPPLPPGRRTVLLGRQADVEHERFARHRQHRRSQHLEHLPGGAVGHAEHLLADRVGVERLDVAAHRRRGHRHHQRRGPVRREAGQVDHAAPDPRGRVAGEVGHGVPGRQVHLHRPGHVEPERAVALQVAGDPAVRGPRLPAQRRVVRVDAVPADRAHELEQQQVRRGGPVESDVERVARLRVLGEAGERAPDTHPGGTVGEFPAGRHGRHDP